jgi:hypothetical protein
MFVALVAMACAPFTHALLAWTACEVKNRVWLLVPRQCRDHCKTHVDSIAIWSRRIQRPGKHATQNLRCDTVEPAFLKVRGSIRPHKKA